MAKRRYETITLNGERFTLDTKATAIESSFKNRTSIFEAYERPSTTKISIWNEWYRWFTDNNGTCTVLSHNCNFFSIGGYVTDKETNKRYYCYITASNNKCIEVV